jgi:hypothetical protein
MRNHLDADREYDVEFHLISEAHAREGYEPGQVIIEHAITDAEVVLDPTDWPEPIFPRVVEAGRLRASRLMRSTLSETLDAQGRRVASVIEIPDIELNSRPSVELIASSVLCPPVPPGDCSLVTGATWSRGDELPSLPGLPLVTSSVLEHIVRDGDESFAVIRSGAELDFNASIGGEPLLLGEVADPNRPEMGMARVNLHSCHIHWEGEDRHRMTDGRRVSTFGRNTHGVQLRLLEPSGLGYLEAGRQDAEQTLEVSIEIEYPS